VEAILLPLPRRGGEGWGEGEDALAVPTPNPLTPALSPEAGEREKDRRLPLPESVATPPFDRLPQLTWR
jgi:hypothetical protein